jgi:hypothetical protein
MLSPIPSKTAGAVTDTPITRIIGNNCMTIASISMRPDGQQQCVLFAFAAPKTKAAEHWSGRFSEIENLKQTM